MAEVPSNISKMLENEVDVDSPVSEALLTKMAANMNGLIDTLANSVTFFSSTTFQVPENVRRIMVFGAGGGGGGAGGQSGGTAKGQRGGCGSVPKGTIIPVTPLSTLTITIGVGGSGGSSGSAGGSGGFSRISASGLNYYFLGGAGGGTPTFGPTPNQKELATPPVGYTAGSEDTTIASRNGQTAEAGQSSVFASGGAGPQGGGGGAGFGTGAAGAPSLASNGLSAGGNTSAGGGGAGGNTGTTGGNGGSGRIIIFY